ncbi:hypothetical protein EB796_005210 [Bugula neritina]|uniref:Uncharacterized protein n=1 Tax=Bugula neritina TaxID=10212 RepID=A0A7J7KG73_BUGNE|nr:hypothetical protein EB796_005210 [Bugula neritina]
MIFTQRTKQHLKTGVVGCALLWVVLYLLKRKSSVSPSGEEVEISKRSNDEYIYDSRQSTAPKIDKLAKLRQAIYDIKRPDDTKYAINETKSQTISVTRSIPDTRPPECLLKSYDIANLPTVSVIIPMYNEAPSILLRTVHSFLSRTPPSLLADIIIVDDMSTNENMKAPLTAYFHELSPVIKILRLVKKAHLIKARMAGAAVARGEVLLFQDGHTEANEGWAEPVLDYIRQHRNSIVQPTVDTVDQWTIEYEQASAENFDSKWRGVFLWDMRRWNGRYVSIICLAENPLLLQVMADIRCRAIPCPVLVGCSIAVHKEYFEEIGGFDTGLDVWGGEQIELSFRAWMCGGRVIIHPCGRAGHIFKPWMKSDLNWMTREKAIAKNNIRVGESWMERYVTYYYASNRIYQVKQVELTEEKLKCKDFDWYLKHVLPELTEPPRDAKYFGEIANVRSSSCLYAASDSYVGLTRDCYLYSRFQEQGEFAFKQDGRLMKGSQCVQVNNYGLLQLISCDLFLQHTELSPSTSTELD